MSTLTTDERAALASAYVALTSALIPMPTSEIVRMERERIGAKLGVPTHVADLDSGVGVALIRLGKWLAHDAAERKRKGQAFG